MLKLDLNILFIIQRALELENLLVFNFFQRKLRLQDVNVERDTYVRLETKLNKVFKVMILIYLLPSLVFMSGEMFVGSSVMMQIGNSYYLAVTTGSIMVYQSTSVQFMIQLYYHHKLAFMTHIKSLLTLFIATEFTLFFLLAFIAYNSAVNFCASTEIVELGLT